MVNQLKTLKDIEMTTMLDFGAWFAEGKKIYLEEDLKAEAVKWVKEIKATIEVGLSIETADKVLMKFFNLTEEDLK